MRSHTVSRIRSLFVALVCSGTASVLSADPVCGNGICESGETFHGCPQDCRIPVSERDALLAFYRYTNGDGWTDNAGWLGEYGTECSWVGIYCDTPTGDTTKTHVTTLDMAVNNLTGSLPPHVGDFPYMDRINLGGNQLTGEIPIDIGGLTELRHLEIWSNALTGSIPSAIGFLSKLEFLALPSNQRKR